MDTGDVLAQTRTKIHPPDTAQTLHDRLAQIAAKLLLETINKLQAGTAIYNRQNDLQATRAPKLKKTDGYIDWNESAETINNKIRGLWPWPGAQTLYLSKKTQKSSPVTIAKAQHVKSKTEKPLPPGTVDENLNVICGQNALKIVQLKPAHGTLMDFKAFVNGRATSPGDLFMKID